MKRSTPIITQKLCESYKAMGLHTVPFQLVSCQITGMGVKRTITLPHFCTMNFVLQMANTNSWRLRDEPPLSARCTMHNGHHPLYVMLPQIGDHLVYKHSGKKISVKFLRSKKMTAERSVGKQLISVSLGNGLDSSQNEEQRVLNRTILGWDRSVFSPLLSHFLIQKGQSKELRSITGKRNREEQKEESPPQKKRKLNEEDQKESTTKAKLEVEHAVQDLCIAAVHDTPPALEKDPTQRPRVTDHEELAAALMKLASSSPISVPAKAVEDDEDPNALHCLCRKPDDGSKSMICCDRCHTWYHQPCVGLTDKMMREMEAQHREYVCPPCIQKE